MKKHQLSLLLIGGLSLTFGACSTRTKVRSAGLQSRQDSIAYAFGVLNGEAFSSAVKEVPGDTLNRAQVVQGFSDIFLGKDVRLSAKDARQIFERYHQELRDKEAKKQLAEADSVLNANQRKEGVKVTESGLQWRVLRAGQGAHPSEQDTVVVHYKGQLADGKVFDSTYKTGEPATFALNQVIPGWAEAVALMNKGAKYEFLLPPSIAYGARGAGNMIPPNAPLFFEIELVDIKPFVKAEEATTTNAGKAPTEPKQGFKIKKKAPRAKR